MLYYLIILILTALLYIVPLLVLLPFQLKLSHKLILFILVLFLLHIVSNIGNVGVIILLVVISAFLAAIDPHKLRNICLFIFSYLINVILSNAEGVVLNLFTGMDIAKLQTTPIIYIAFACSSILIAYAVCKLIVFAFQRVTQRLMIPQLPKKALLFIMINLLLTLALFVMNIIMGEQLGYSPIVVAFNTCIFLVYFGVSTWTIIRSIQVYQKEVDMKSKEESFAAMQQYNHQMEAYYQELRSFKHDFSNITLTLTGYIEENDMAGLSQYFRNHIAPLAHQITTKNTQIANLGKIHIIELKSLINTKLLYAQEKQIDVKIEIENPITDLPMDIIDLCRIIGIFLDNAIEAALETDNPSLSFIIISTEKETVFRISNSFANTQLDLTKLSMPEYTTKGRNRGIGLSNAAAIIADHNNIYLETYIEREHFVQMMHIYISADMDE